MEEGNVTAPKPKRKYKPRAVCTDPELKYRYKKKPGRKPKVASRRELRARKFEGTDAEARRYARRCAGAQVRTEKCRAAAKERLLSYKQTMDPERLSRVGIPNGMTREEAKEAWAAAKAQADKVFKQMVEQGIAKEVSLDEYEAVTVITAAGDEKVVYVPITDDAKASAALKEAVTLALGPTNQQVKLSAIRTVLEYTKAKPASKIEASVSKAEDWLAAVTADALKNDGSK